MKIMQFPHNDCAEYIVGPEMKIIIKIFLFVLQDSKLSIFCLR